VESGGRRRTEGFFLRADRGTKEELCEPDHGGKKDQRIIFREKGKSTSDRLKKKKKESPLQRNNRVGGKNGERAASPRIKERRRLPIAAKRGATGTR